MTGSDDHDPPGATLPGTTYGPLSLKPLTEGLAFAERTFAYTADKRAAAGCPVFHAHPGVKSVLVTHHAGLDAVFHAPPEQLDREATPGFGAVSFQHEDLFDGTVPALMTDRADHRAARTLIDRAMALRDAAFVPACQPLLDDGWPTLAGKDQANFEEAMVGAAVAISFRWLFDLDGPSGASQLAWLRDSFGLRTDTRLTDWLAWAASRRTKAATIEHAHTWLAAIQASEPFSAFRAEGEAVGLDDHAVAVQLFFAAGFNAAGGVYTTAFPAFAELHHKPAVRQALANELEGFSGTVDDLDTLPYLEAFLIEVQRLYGRPRQYYRTAVTDVEIPGGGPGGCPAHLPAGTRVGLVAVHARQDPAVFDDPAAFRPERYLDDPALKAKVMPFGPPDGGGSPYGCAGAVNNTAGRMWKALVASLARDTDWRLSPTPTPDINGKTGVDPDSLTWHRR